ncbi:NAD(P)/FAD-dependent oxidoreductase [Saccharopolyspora rosea]|uniref:NAD(P)/FAD-dependent oxidoreductase n=1 Tax=Saccharopolyspora rosea TaxID=524884 RepID=UPI0021D7E2AE|nr:FAD-dependent oxidoreductase [Saccharopolyspora rosea]
MTAGHRAPRRVGVVGAGMNGLACAWFLQQAGVDVTVVERTDVAAGASWGNAGLLTPALSVPLPEPSVLRYGVRALADPRSPVSVPVRADRDLARFLTRFVAHCTGGRWRRGMAAYRPLNEQALEAFDELARGGVAAPTRVAPFTAACRTEREAEHFAAEIGRVVGAGQAVDVELLTASELRDQLPMLAPSMRMGVRVLGQRAIDPPAYVAALADSVRARGGKIVTGVDVAGVRRDGGKISLATRDGQYAEQFDAAVLASGAWLPELGAAHGVRTPVHGGRGYSFTVDAEHPIPEPVDFPGLRLACAPYRGGVRVTGIMEFQRPDAAADERKFATIRESAAAALTTVDWSSARDHWVGARPVTSDGLPLIGATATPGLHVTGGHGMWGMTLGPLSGKLLAELIVTGRTPRELLPLDPCR